MVQKGSAPPTPRGITACQHRHDVVEIGTREFTVGPGLPDHFVKPGAVPLPGADFGHQLLRQHVQGRRRDVHRVEQAILDERPGGDADDAFGGRVDAEHRVVGDRFVFTALGGGAEAGDPGEFAVTPDGDLGTGQPPLDVTLDVVIEGREPSWIDPDRCGVGGDEGVQLGVSVSLSERSGTSRGLPHIAARKAAYSSTSAAKRSARM